jgi:DNA-binding NarL/FixJ family response regulator
MRRGLRLLLEQQADFQVVGEADDGRQAVDLAASLHPGVAVLQPTNSALAPGMLQEVDSWVRRMRPTCRCSAEHARSPRTISSTYGFSEHGRVAGLDPLKASLHEKVG